MGEEKLSDSVAHGLRSLLELGDPEAGVAVSYAIKKRLRDFCGNRDPDEARTMLRDLLEHCVSRAMPPEIQKLGRTIETWFDKICNFSIARVSNAPTEAANNLIKRVKRLAFGITNFRNYRVRSLLYASTPNWSVLPTLTPR